MGSTTNERSVELPCHLCGYDLRAHPPDGKCPECGASVAEAARVAAIPRRPAWRDSDPRWRRRMLAGVWVLALVPLMDALNALDWASRVPVPNIYGYGAIRSLADTFVAIPWIYPPLVFCIGVALLFSKERGRRRAPLDWTRRWGVICTCVVLLLSAAQALFVPALVLAGIAALFLSMPLQNQPGVTQLFAAISSGYLRYGSHPGAGAAVALVSFSSVTILLACVALLEALRSTGAKRLGTILLAPLALFSLMHLVQAAWHGLSIVPSRDVFNYAVYFSPELLVESVNPAVVTGWRPSFLVEALKWCIILVLAVWLSTAQLLAWRQRHRRGSTATPAGVPSRLS